MCRNAEIDKDLTKSMLDNCKELVPELLDEKGSFKVISQQVGLRPSRTGGVRIEAESVEVEGLGNVYVVHCYGHGGAG